MQRAWTLGEQRDWVMVWGEVGLIIGWDLIEDTDALTLWVHGLPIIPLMDAKRRVPRMVPSPTVPPFCAVSIPLRLGSGVLCVI